MQDSVWGGVRDTLPPSFRSRKNLGGGFGCQGWGGVEAGCASPATQTPPPTHNLPHPSTVAPTVGCAGPSTALRQSPWNGEVDAAPRGTKHFPEPRPPIVSTDSGQSKPSRSAGRGCSPFWTIFDANGCPCGPNPTKVSLAQMVLISRQRESYFSSFLYLPFKRRFSSKLHELPFSYFLSQRVNQSEPFGRLLITLVRASEHAPYCIFTTAHANSRR